MSQGAVAQRTGPFQHNPVRYALKRYRTLRTPHIASSSSATSNIAIELPARVAIASTSV